ncbi:MAG: hypothetical protein CM1200mP29_15160 [Verrucomicrobiota bacterium]|nr:MAG: hypothetical protein CM1200mP29_15160 [Verrucomicrobiota bacterium]
MPPGTNQNPSRDRGNAHLAKGCSTATGQAAKRTPPAHLNPGFLQQRGAGLFQLNRDVFALSEKLMTRETISLNARDPRAVKPVAAFHPTGA